MSRMQVSQFAGIDLRARPVSSNPRTVRSATNVELTLSGGFRMRPGFRVVADVHPESHGLFSLDNKLAAIVPAGRLAYKTQQPFNVEYFPIGRSIFSDYPDGLIARVERAIAFGAAPEGSFPYISVRLQDGSIEHHWINDLNASNGARVDTRVSHGFRPGPAILKHRSRVITTNETQGSVDFCTAYGGLVDTQFGPRDWATPGDAGSLFTAMHVSSQKNPVWLELHNDTVVVFFPDALQFWEFNADPATNRFIRTIQGPGTRVYGSVASIGNDLVYMSDGGFTTLSTVAVTGEKSTAPIGAPIHQLTQEEHVLFRQSALGFNPWVSGQLLRPLSNLDRSLSLWSEQRSQYLCAINREGGTCRVYVYTWNKLHEIQGWTFWELPFPVDAMTENDGTLFIRSGTLILEASYAEDTDMGTPIEWEVQLQDLTTRSVTDIKRWRTLDLDQEGECDVAFRFRADSEDPQYWIRGPTVKSETFSRQPIRLVGRSQSLGIRFSGTKRWNLDGILLDYSPSGRGR